MNPDDQPTLERSFELRIDLPEIPALSGRLALFFAQCSAEAQMLEHAIKSAITKDIHVFAIPGDEVSFLKTLETVTMGQAKNIAMGTSSAHADISACLGFFNFVKMQWNFSSRPEAELSQLFKDAVSRRNRLAHQLLAEVLCSEISSEDAISFLQKSIEVFTEVRHLIVFADSLSAKMGSVGTDGRSLPRFKTTS